MVPVPDLHMMSLMVPATDFAYGVMIDTDATDGTCT
jgi:hypothetical protein